MSEDLRIILTIIACVIIAILMNVIFVLVIDNRTEKSANDYEECIKAEYGQTVEQIRSNNNGRMPTCNKNLQ